MGNGKCKVRALSGPFLLMPTFNLFLFVSFALFHCQIYVRTAELQSKPGPGQCILIAGGVLDPRSSVPTGGL